MDKNGILRCGVVQMLSIKVPSPEVDCRSWLRVPSGCSDPRQVVEMKKKQPSVGKSENLLGPFIYKSVSSVQFKEKKEKILPSPMTNAPTLTEKSNKQRDNIKNATKNFDYTTIADRLSTVSWSNRSYPTCVVKPVYKRSTLPLTTTVV